jgi:hypothetical protein
MSAPGNSINAPLSPLQARVIGVLYEKEKTVPDTYPLSLNALTAGCNQKNNRDPLMDASETEVRQAIDALRARTFVIESSGLRVMRYEHNLARVLRIPEQAAALLACLLLRGPQTAAELRINAERLHRFADAGSVEAFLDELRQRPADRGGPLVVLLPRVHGAREPRWAHLLCGPVTVDPRAAAAGGDRDLEAAPALPAGLQHTVAALSGELAALRARVLALEVALGVAQAAAPGLAPGVAREAASVLRDEAAPPLPSGAAAASGVAARDPVERA